MFWGLQSLVLWQQFEFSAYELCVWRFFFPWHKAEFVSLPCWNCPVLGRRSHSPHTAQLWSLLRVVAASWCGHRGIYSEINLISRVHGYIHMYTCAQGKSFALRIAKIHWNGQSSPSRLFYDYFIWMYKIRGTSAATHCHTSLDPAYLFYSQQSDWVQFCITEHGY